MHQPFWYAEHYGCDHVYGCACDHVYGCACDHVYTHIEHKYTSKHHNISLPHTPHALHHTHTHTQTTLLSHILYHKYPPHTHTQKHTEQLYSHMAALALASQLHAQPIMPPALTKDEQGKWAPVPLQTILNFKRTRKNAQGMGLQLHVVPSEMYGYLPTETLWHGSTDELNRVCALCMQCWWW